MRRDFRIGLKYCGGCNPEIDRKALAEMIQRRLPGPWKLTTEEGDGPWETALLLCGCPTACADRPEVRRSARRWLVIAGNMVNDEAVSAGQMVEHILAQLKHFLGGPEGETDLS